MTCFTRWAFALLVLTVPFDVATPQVREPIAKVWPGFVNTERYIGFDQNQQGIYAAGLADGMYLAPFFDAPNENKSLTAMRACLKPMTNTQVAAIITQYAKAHPEKWDKGVNLVAWQALQEACFAR